MKVNYLSKLVCSCHAIGWLRLMCMLFRYNYSISVDGDDANVVDENDDENADQSEVEAVESESKEEEAKHDNNDDHDAYAVDDGDVTKSQKRRFMDQIDPMIRKTLLNPVIIKPILLNDAKCYVAQPERGDATALWKFTKSILKQIKQLGAKTIKTVPITPCMSYLNFLSLCRYFGDLRGMMITRTTRVWKVNRVCLIQPIQHWQY